MADVQNRSILDWNYFVLKKYLRKFQETLIETFLISIYRYQKCQKNYRSEDKRRLIIMKNAALDLNVLHLTINSQLYIIYMYIPV